jgi:4-hydroxy-tetrahydrodipicolinate synthase
MQTSPSTNSPSQPSPSQGAPAGKGQTTKGVSFQGVFSVLPTPFDSQGQLDRASLARVIDLYLAAGVNGFTTLGVTSEVARLDDRERGQVLEAVLEHTAGRVPVVVGASASGLGTAIGYSRAAKAAGAVAVMVSPPRLAKPTADGLTGFYASLASAADIPIVVQDFPPVSGFTMEPALLARIAREVPAARAIKLEDPPTPWKIGRILEAAGPELKILGGLGGVFLLEELLAGAAGTMTGFAYPEILVRVVRLYREGKIDEAAGVFYHYVPLMRFEFQEGIGIALRKEVLRRRGAIAHAGIRPPGMKPDAATLAALDRLLGWLRAQKEESWISI